MSKLISVVIPTFNRAHCIGRAIESVLAQTLSDWELVIVDDGSTDGTADVLSNYKGHLRIIKQPRSGPAAARNTGIRCAHGQFVAFLDSDDEWMSNKLEMQLPLMLNKFVVLSATNWIVRNSQSTRTAFDAYDFKGSWTCNSSPHLVSRPGGSGLMLSSWMVRRDVLVKLGGFNPSLRLAQDNDLMFRLAFEGQFALTKLVLLLREATLDNVKQSQPGDLAYHRDLARCMCIAASNARVLAFDETIIVERRFARIYAHYLRKEMELAAMDGKIPQARRRALETLLCSPGTRDALMALLGYFLPGYVGRRSRNKYRYSSVNL